MTDTMRTRLNLILTAAVAFAVGLVATGPLDLTPRGMAGVANPPLELDLRGAPERGAVGAPVAGFAEIAEEVTPAVVTIEIEREVETAHLGIPIPLDGQPLAPASGSGFIISDDGYIVTNNHVVAGARSIEVLLADGRRFDAVRLVGRDPTTDIALLKLDAPDLVHAPIGSSEATRVGDWVLAIGSPGFRDGRGMRSSSQLITTVTAGIISAKSRSIEILRRQFSPDEPSPAIEDFIQTDAVINPGNSGGPLVNAAGEVIGVNTAIASTTGSYQGYGFAVPIDLVREVVEDLVEHGTVRRAILGITVQDVDDADARYYGLDRVGGAIVMSVAGESPAAEAGLAAGHVIIGVAGRRVSSVTDLQRAIRTFDPGETVTVEYVDRGGERHEARVELIAADPPQVATAMPETASDPATTSVENPLGIRVQEIDGEMRRGLDLPDGVDGVVITDVDVTGPLSRRAQRYGYDPFRQQLRHAVITEVNGRDIESVSDYRDAIAEVEPGDVVGLTLYDARQEGRGIAPAIPLTVPIPSR